MKVELNPKNLNVVLYFSIPAFKRQSAGVVTLYKIIDVLNRCGIRAYVIPDPISIGNYGYSRFFSEKNYITPTLTISDLDFHLANNFIPVICYTDTSLSNKFFADNIIKFLMYFEGKLNKKSQVNAKNEAVVYFSDAIKKKIKKKKYLFIQRISFPIADPQEFQSSLKTEKVYYYSEKFIHAFGGEIPKDIKETCIRITRDQIDSLNRAELKKALSEAKLLHAFEDSAIIYEAQLAGCPVNIHPLGYFPNNGRPLADKELGNYGLIYKVNPTQLDIIKAKRELSVFNKNYNKWMESGLKDIFNLATNLRKFDKHFNEATIRMLIKSINEANKAYYSSMIADRGCICDGEYRKSNFKQYNKSWFSQKIYDSLILFLGLFTSPLRNLLIKKLKLKSIKFFFNMLPEKIKIFILRSLSKN
jgi:hypothetical protein